MPASTAQLTVRIPSELRRRVKQRAVADGVSVQTFVERTLRAAVDVAPTVSDETADRLVEFIRSGGYDELVRHIVDDEPDLATM